MNNLKDFGLWTRRLLAIMIITYVGYMVWTGGLEGQDVKEMALLVLGFYFASTAG